MHICVVSPNYPTSKTIDFVFVDQLFRAIADKNIKVSIIAPQSVTKSFVRNVPIVARKSKIQTKCGNEIDLYRPLYVTYGNIGGLSKLNRVNFNNAVRRAHKLIRTPIDVYYGHFWESAFSLINIAFKAKKPLFVASGEERVAFHNYISEAEKQRLISSVSGVVSVSTKNKKECVESGLTTEERCVVIPNAIDNNLFQCGNKQEARQKLGFPKNCFIVAFVGQFTIRKGTLRLDNALKALADPQIKAVFIGSGNEDPTYEGIIYKGRVAHDDLPSYIQAADIFVLPTLNEGCCNAIIESLACGVPVVSSNLPFNYDVLNADNSVLLDPNNVDEISNAIRYLKNNRKIINAKSSACLESAKQLTLDKRADKILHFINTQIEKL